MKKTLIALSIAAMSAMPTHAHAFSFKNIFKRSLSSVLNPFHIVYKLNILIGVKPTTMIPKFAIRDEDRNWQYNYQTNNWDRYTINNTYPPVPPPLYEPDYPARPNPPAPVIVTPPCQRGGPGITPC